MEVLIVGAGVIGCAIARELALDHEVRVLDRNGVAGGATGRSAGLIAPTLFFGDLPETARYANAFFERFDGTGEFSFTRRERLDLVGAGVDTDSAGSEGDEGSTGGEGAAGNEADEERKARKRAARLYEQGFPVRYLDGAAIEARHPAFDADSFAGAVRYGDTGWVDPYTYTIELRRAAERRGARFETSVEGRAIAEREGGVEIETSEGRRRADRVVLAAGWRTPDLVGGNGTPDPIPVSPYRTQCVVLDPVDSLPRGFPLVRASGEKLYFRPEHDGTLLVGGGYGLVDPTAASEAADERFRNHVAEAIPRLIDGFDDAGFVIGWAGVDSGTPDGRPVIDTISERVVVATGFSGLGVMASPIAAGAVRALVTGESETVPLEPFRHDRFEGTEAGVRFTSDA
ncbi:FAD-binding oxidoreductase [Halobacteriales archaeon QH_6_64_20]|nr:MAG: FAD-binding oxidoreductase [Halobacteriales archaeon QH_6_64_20]